MTDRGDNPIELLLDEDKRRISAARAMWEGPPAAFRNWHERTPYQRHRITRPVDEIMKETPTERSNVRRTREGCNER